MLLVEAQDIAAVIRIFTEGRSADVVSLIESLRQQIVTPQEITLASHYGWENVPVGFMESFTVW